MKKLLGIILVAAMLLSLCSCGPETITEDPFVIQIKGNGSRNVKVNIADSLPGDCSKEISKLDSDEGMSLSCSETGGAHSVTYTLSGQQPGIMTVCVNYRDGDEDVAVIGFMVSVDEKSKLTCSAFTIDDGNQYETVGEYEISEFEGGTKTIRLAGGDDSWEVGSCDRVVSVSAAESDEEYSFITIVALKEGEGHLQLLNRSEKKELDVSLSAAKDEADNLILSIDEITPLEYTPENDQALIAVRKDFLEEAGEVAEGISIPESAYITDYGISGSKGKAFEKTENPDTASVQFEFGGGEFAYEVSTKAKYSEIIKSYAELEPETDEDTKIGGRDVHYIYVKGESGSGFGVAVWQEEGSVHTLTVISGGTDAECRRLMGQFFAS